MGSTILSRRSLSGYKEDNLKHSTHLVATASMLDGLHGGHSSHELKQQGAIEAAQDPHSRVTAEDAEQKMLEESRKAGTAAFQFDPDASAAEKAQQARAVSSLDLFDQREALVDPLNSVCRRNCKTSAITSLPLLLQTRTMALSPPTTCKPLPRATRSLLCPPLLEPCRPTVKWRRKKTGAKTD